MLAGSERLPPTLPYIPTFYNSINVPRACCRLQKAPPYPTYLPFQFNKCAKSLDSGSRALGCICIYAGSIPSASYGVADGVAYGMDSLIQPMEWIHSFSLRHGFSRWSLWPGCSRMQPRCKCSHVRCLQLLHLSIDANAA